MSLSNSAVVQTVYSTENITRDLFDASQKIAILQTLFDNIDEINNVYDEEIDLAEFVVRDAERSDAINNVIVEEHELLKTHLNSFDTLDRDTLFANYGKVKFLTKSDPMEIALQNARAVVTANSKLVRAEGANSGDNPAFDLIGLTKLRNDPQFAGIDGSGLSVAVIDTGIDTDHPLIAPNYVAGYDFIDKDNVLLDPDGHGTHVSGTIGATDESIGVAPDVNLIGLRALDNEGEGSIAEVEDALEWVLENRDRYNITAVNLSLGIGFFTSERELQGDIISDDIQRLEAAGVTIISATGNNYFATSGSTNQANVSFPAISSTIAVGAVWQDGTEPDAFWESGSIDYSTGTDRITSFSQRLDAPNVIFAPGAIITSTLPGGVIGEDAGTSQASPHVAGAVALLQEASLQFGGRLLTPVEVNDILRATGDEIIDGDNEDDNVSNTNISYLRLNIYNAVSEVKRKNYNLTVSSQNELASRAKVYRFFRPDIGVHFYTASEVERDSIISNLSDYSYEGASYIAAHETADPITGAKPVHRFLNTNTGAHLYTMSDTEYNSINNLPNYAYEEIAYYAYESNRPGAIPLYRFYNSVIDAHFYTPSTAEKDAILANLPDYQLESNDGIAFYVEPIAEM